MHRDSVFRKFRFQFEGREYLLLQAISDDSLWFVRSLGYPIEGLVVYVDDVALFGPEGLRECVLNVIREQWTTSEPQWVKDGQPLTFCGLELHKTSRGYKLLQKAYLAELLQRYAVTETAAAPISRWEEPEDEGPLDPADIKWAQGITGALLWAATRSRPDLSYAVSRMSQYAVKRPVFVRRLGLQVLGFVCGTLELGIEYEHTIRFPLGEHGHLAVPRTETVVETYSDASHAPSGGKSVQSVFVLWRSSLLFWESGRQSFTTLSSAESELVSMVHGVQVAESIQPLIEEILEQDTSVVLHADNSAAVRAYEPSGAGWRNRHLRMRAASGRERIAAGTLVVSHLAGEFQIADVGTKPLPKQKLFQLLELASVREASSYHAVAASRAQVLRRLAWECVHVESVSPATLLVLSVLAMAQPVAAQPSEHSWVMSWFDVGMFGIGLILVVLLGWVVGKRSGVFSGLDLGVFCYDPPLEYVDPLIRRELYDEAKVWSPSGLVLNRTTFPFR